MFEIFQKFLTRNTCKYVSQSTRHEKVQHFYHRVGNKTLPLAMTSPEFNYLCHPKVKHSQARKEGSALKSARPYVLAIDTENNGRKAQKGKHPFNQPLTVPFFGILRH